MDTKLIQPQTDTQPEAPSESEGGVMGFFDHIEELRKRLIRALLSVLVALAFAVFFTNPVIAFMKQSYGERLLLLDPTDSIVVFFRVALMLSAIIASPMITYQILMFIFPGLTRKEKRWLLLSMPAVTALFLLGVLFTWFYLIPFYIDFLKNFQADIFQVQWTADNYIGFLTAVVFWHAAAFETPVIFYVLARMGLVTSRSMIRYWRHAIVIAAIIAAFITPTVDPLTMTVVMVVLLGLYFVSVILVFLASRLSPWNKKLPAS